MADWCFIRFQNPINVFAVFYILNRAVVINGQLFFQYICIPIPHSLSYSNKYMTIALECGMAMNTVMTAAEIMILEGISLSIGINLLYILTP